MPITFFFVGAWAYINGRRFVFIDNSWDVEVMPSVLIADAPYARDEARRDFWKHQGDILGSIS